MKLQELIEKHYDGNLEIPLSVFSEFIELLDNGKIRAAELINNDWQVNEWVKKGILLGFRLGVLTDMSIGDFQFFEKSTYPLKKFNIEDNIRIVPGGSTFRKGCYIAPGVVIMPPCYVNVGGYVDTGTMLDSHALVGSCAQVGKRCHISAASQIGGVLEPINASPVIIEDNVFIGGNCGVYEGVLVRKNSILASGVTLTASTSIYDLVNKDVIRADKNGRVTVPENAVVVPGSRPAKGDFAAEQGVNLYTPVIVKYRDGKSDAKSCLEESLRVQ
jgi:2,3,4,5-tetrahydropyridine-2-carboxylate N-succinyltransferase